MTAPVAVPAPSAKRFWLVHLVAPLLVGVAAIGALHLSGLDRAALDAAFDESTGSFPWRRHVATERVLHWGGKHLAMAVAFVAAVLLAASWRKRALVAWRGPLALFVASMVLGPLATSAGKSLSTARCPWDLERYGGFARHEVNHVADGTVGRRGCFPCGQASAGFALMSSYFALRRRRPRWARVGLWLGFGYGALLGAGRVLQGAHYPSHVVGTALVCWTVALLLYAATLRRSEARATTE